jgi:hypothetical protein
MNQTRIVAVTEDGVEHDVTQDVAALYDLVVGSMDFGSGFITVDDAEPLARMADLAGYHDPDHWRKGPSLIEQARAQVAARAAEDAT